MPEAGYHPITKDGETPPKENLYEIELVLSRSAKLLNALSKQIGEMETSIRSEIAYIRQQTGIAAGLVVSNYVRRGSVALVAGVGTVADALVTANTIVEYWVFTPGGTRGFLSYANTAGTGFAINSSSALETSTVQYKIVSY